MGSLTRGRLVCSSHLASPFGYVLVRVDISNKRKGGHLASPFGYIQHALGASGTYGATDHEGGRVGGAGYSVWVHA